jgi:hypothetical protein
MNATVQQILVIAAVLGALLYLVLRGRKKKGCGSEGGCGCATKKPPLK